MSVTTQTERSDWTYEIGKIGKLTATLKMVANWKTSVQSQRGGEIQLLNTRPSDGAALRRAPRTQVLACSAVASQTLAGEKLNTLKGVQQLRGHSSFTRTSLGWRATIYATPPLWLIWNLRSEAKSEVIAEKQLTAERLDGNYATASEGVAKIAHASGDHGPFAGKPL